MHPTFNQIIIDYLSRTNSFSRLNRSQTGIGV